MKQVNLLVLFLLVGLMGFQISANSVDSDVDVVLRPLKQEWAVIKYTVPEGQQVAKLENLIKRVQQVSASYPHSAEPIVWHGTMLSTLASLKGGLSALGAAKKARKDLELALTKDATAENGYAHVILGALYSKVPGRPIGFGSKDKARRHFQTALKMDPQGMDANFFYAEFLMDQGEYSVAKKHLETAMVAEVDSEYKVFAEGRKEEVTKALAQVQQKLRA